MKKALITGIAGQDGSYLAELLLSKGYSVHGVLRRTSFSENSVLELISTNGFGRENLHLHFSDISDVLLLKKILLDVRPDEIYHMAGQSHVGESFVNPESTIHSASMSIISLLEYARTTDFPVRILNIGSSEVFGRPEVFPQNVNTPMVPVSPYGAARAFTVNSVRIWREAFGVFAVNAICYNHESPRRGAAFVTRKIANAVAEIALGKRKYLELGNLDVQRDWGYAPEYVDAMWRMLQTSKPRDFILSTGVLTTLEEFLNNAFCEVGLNWRDYVRVNPNFVRPVEPAKLVGDPSDARTILSWQANVTVQELARIMVKAEVATIQGRNPAI